MPIDTCPDCGKERTASLCPRCLLMLGIDAQRPHGGVLGSTIDQSPRQGSVLGTIATTLDGVPRVLLRELAIGETPSPVIPPESGNDATPRYRIDGEIARGGMGAVLRGRDSDLGRDVALKVLREDLRDDAGMVRRFVEEAQIGGQLQHPGNVPIYEMGTLGDGRPFFSMKLVKGQTLAELLGARTSPADGLPRFLSIFEAIAQTVSYAHARGVIHRDLKPSNVMVGSFGEVQVMDWGLAKILPHGGVLDDARSGEADHQETLITTRSTSEDSELSHAGAVMGTPSYMAPEQARGETDRVDERIDVFALGSILCEILTGQPAFTGRSSGEVQSKAARGDLVDALSKLDDAGADADLVSLAKACLASELEARPREAGAVASRVTAYLAGVQERLRSAERERAVAEATAVEERKRRRLQLSLAACMVALTALAGMGTAYEVQQRSVRAAALAKVLGEARTLRDLARGHPADAARWQAALAAVEQAEGVAGDDPEAAQQLTALRDDVRAGADAARRDRVLLDLLVDIRSAKADDREGSVTNAAYADAFRAAGINLSTLSPEEAGRIINARPPSVALALAAALDDWAAVRRTRRKDPAGTKRLADVARLADPDPWRNGLRNTLESPDQPGRLAALKALAGAVRYDQLGPVSLVVLGTALDEVDDPKTAESVLRAARRRHPGDVWLNYELARVLEKLRRRADAIRYYTAARALRPETAHELAHALWAAGEPDEALAVFRDLARLRPGDARHLMCLGNLLQEQGRVEEAAGALERAVAASREAIRLKPDSAEGHYNLGASLIVRGKQLGEAVAALREAIRLEPDDAEAHYHIGSVLTRQGRHDEAAAEYREAIRLRPDHVEAHANLGLALRRQGDLDGAVAELREAIRLEPDAAFAHNSLGATLGDQGKFVEAAAAGREAIRLRPDLADSHMNLGLALRGQGDLDGAVAELREAIRLEPDYIRAHHNLGVALGEQGRHDEAAAEYREAIRLEPDDAEAHRVLGVVLGGQGRHDEAAAEYREAIRLRPDHAETHYNLGNALMAEHEFEGATVAFSEALRLKPDHTSANLNLGNALWARGKLEKAAVAFREAIRLKPDLAEAHCNLGMVLGRLGDQVGALTELRTGHGLGSRRTGWRYPSAQWVAEAERQAALALRLPAVLQGDDRPLDAAEALTFAELCRSHARHAAAARMFEQAFTFDPKTAEDRQAQNRYNAACYAAMAAAGRGQDDPAPDDAAKAKLRQQAFAWLRAEHAAWTKRLESPEPGAREQVANAMHHWRKDPDLAGIREPDPLAKLPEPGRAAWRTLWADIEALLDRAEGTTP